MTDQQDNQLVAKRTVSQNVQKNVQTNAQTSDEQQAKLNEPHLSQKETRQIVTPYAFFVADELLGTPLARPMRRGMAMAIDLVFIGLLTQVSNLVLAAVAAATFFRAGNRLKTKKRFNGVRIFLRLLVAILLFVVALGIVDEITDQTANTRNTDDITVDLDTEINGMEVLALTAKSLLKTKEITEQIKQGECAPALTCVQPLGEEIVSDVVAMGGRKDLLKDVIDSYAEGVSQVISQEQLENLKVQLNTFADSQLVMTVNQNQVQTEQSIYDTQPRSLSPAAEPPVNEALAVDDSKAQTKNGGLLNRVEETLEELGLGLGWAAFYFSVFTAWWKGQTPGKKLMGIKVIKLDNQPLNLWESFGRYGGYAAGFATGLSGFLQVLWDPNRQAIQDKISETLVIDLRRPKVAFVKDSEDKS